MEGREERSKWKLEGGSVPAGAESPSGRRDWALASPQEGWLHAQRGKCILSAAEVRSRPDGTLESERRERRVKR